jgi:hypothetical protein
MPRCAAALVALALIGQSPTVHAAVWLAGVDPFVRARMPGAGDGDFNALFEPDAPWKRAARTVSVFKVSTQYLLNGSDDELRRMIAGLSQRGIALAFEALMIPRHGACGHVEGYSDPGTIAQAAQRVKRLGGVLAYAAMDEPLWFGHFDQSPAACRSSIDAVAAGVAENVRALRAVFPAVQVGDIEPFQGAAARTLQPADVMAFAEAYRRATGTPLVFFHADLDWAHHADTELTALKSSLSGSAIRFGVIFDGDADDPTDIAWTRHAEARFEDIEQVAAEKPDDAILQTWMIRPSHMLPESAPGTMTNLVLLYAREASRLSLAREGDAVVGRLTTASATPIGATAIRLSIEDGRSARIVTRRTLDGVVPSGAAKALVGVRVNTESAGVARGEIALGDAQYREAGGPAVERDPLGANDPGRPLAIAMGQPLSRGGPPFAVTPGQPFTLEVPMGATAGLDAAGYVALIFLGADGREIKRVEIPLTSSRRPLEEARTDAQGRFRLTAVPPPSNDLVIVAAYGGDEQRRGAAATTN